MRNTLLLSLVAGLATGAFAQQEPASQQKPALPTPGQAATPPAAIPGLDEKDSRAFHRFDRNGDGQISEEEFRNAVVRLFTRIDKNHRGYIDISELKSANPEVLQQLKANKQEHITLPQLTDAMMSAFHDADKDNDGTLSPEEFKTLHTPMLKAS